MHQVMREKVTENLPKDLSNVAKIHQFGLKHVRNIHLMQEP